MVMVSSIHGTLLVKVVVVEHVIGETDEERIHEPVSLWNILRVRQAERAGESQHHLDC